MTSTLAYAKPEDDRFHRIESNDPAWIETVWFPFWVPERSLTGYVHLHFCPNRCVYRGSVSLWRGRNEILFLTRFEEPLPTLREYGELDGFNLPVGLSVRCTKPLLCFDIAFTHADCSLRLSYDGLMTPVMMAPDDAPGMFHGHMNQSGRLTGEIRLRDERIPVNCYTVRDRSWGPRHAASHHRAGNCHGTSGNTCFYIYVRPDTDGNELITNGHLLQNGQCARVTSGRRTVEWRGDQPEFIQLQMCDELGRELKADGECLNLRLTKSPPNLCVVLNLVRWSLPGELLVGESHDVWSEAAWSSAGRSPIA